ncbi:hypothetical protein PVAND_001645 [Polypedilum vanderplanki]|uniref:Glucosylceramidase n=1 Tax=Polypedilum vanderplanki TaxID=319348 RepID=A0A9J6BNJ4_POLVA|nr:hypothetical protein PVAND_001645 [Polypedilum vanderplanki]
MHNMILKFLSIFATLSLTTATSLPCILKSFNTGLVCVCNSTYCDNLIINLPVKRSEVHIFSTSKSGLRFHEAKSKFNNEKIKIPNGAFHYGSDMPPYYKRFMQVVQKVEGIDEPVDSVVNVEINRTAHFQKILGFGGAFTGAVSYNLKLLSKELQEHVYKAYYSKDIGIGYNLMRIPIGGCDFDLASWTYNEKPEHDPYLSNFTHLDERDLDKIKQINELKKITKNNDIKIFGAAWSPPIWMKTNNEYTGLSALREEYYQTWADYHVKYLELMAKNNLPFWAISTGNEPLNGILFPYFVHFMSLGWDPAMQGKWLGENLGPAMKNSTFTKNILILGGDDQRYTLPIWFQQMFKSNGDSCDYLDGFAVHWYADKFVPAKMLDDTATLFPDKFIIATEASSGDRPWDMHKPVLGSWSRFEDYTIDIMEDFNHFVSAWVDWNLILDEEGGPNYAKNTVDAAMIATENQIYKQPIFYAIGHFSKFVLPGSVRIKSKPSNRFIKSVSFLRPDGYIVVILYNIAEHSMDVNVFDKEHGVLRLELPAKSLHTLIYK